MSEIQGSQIFKFKLSEWVDEFKQMNEIPAHEEVPDELIGDILQDEPWFEALCDGKYMKNWGNDERLTPVYDEFHSIIGAIDNAMVHLLYHCWRSDEGCCDYWQDGYQLLVHEHPFGGWFDRFDYSARRMRQIKKDVRKEVKGWLARISFVPDDGDEVYMGFDEIETFKRISRSEREQYLYLHSEFEWFGESFHLDNPVVAQ